MVYERNEIMKKYGYIMLLGLSSLIGCRQEPVATLPAFDLLLADGATILNTGSLPEGNISMFIHFDSDCKGCQKETRSLLQHMDALKDVSIYFITAQELEQAKVFRDHFKLASYSNIAVAQDVALFFPRHFNNGVTPLLALYDRKQRLRAVFEGEADMNKLLSVIEDIR